MRGRCGMMLIEVMAAVAILGTVGGAYLVLTSTTLRRVEQAGARERDFAAADEFMGATTLWTRDDLDRRLGERKQGPWLLEVQRESPRLYSLRLRDSATRAVVLETAVYRANP